MIAVEKLWLAMALWHLVGIFALHMAWVYTKSPRMLMLKVMGVLGLTAVGGLGLIVADVALILMCGTQVISIWSLLLGAGHLAACILIPRRVFRARLSALVS